MINTQIVDTSLTNISLDELSALISLEVNKDAMITINELVEFVNGNATYNELRELVEIEASLTNDKLDRLINDVVNYVSLSVENGMKESLHGVLNSIQKTTITKIATAITKQELVTRIIDTLLHITSNEQEDVLCIVEKIGSDMYNNNWGLMNKLVEQALCMLDIDEHNKLLSSRMYPSAPPPSRMSFIDEQNELLSTRMYPPAPPPSRMSFTHEQNDSSLSSTPIHVPHDE